MGFLIHDIDCDGFISPKDVIEFQTRFCTETSYLLPYDISTLTRKLQSKIDNDPPDEFEATAEGILLDA